SGGRVLELDENAADFFDLFVCAEDVFVAEQVSEAELAGLVFGFGAGVKGSVFGSQLLGRVAGHPESFFVAHAYLSRWDSTARAGSVRGSGLCFTGPKTAGSKRPKTVEQFDYRDYRSRGRNLKR